MTMTHTVKGNQTSRPSTLSAPALNLDWNFDNQLRGADTNGSAGSLEVTFEYDALGRRVSRSHSSGNVVYVHAGQQVIADYARGAVTSSPTYRYVYADYVDEPIVRHTGTATTLPTTGDNALYYHRNQQYSIIGLTNAAGTLVERYSYTAYGTLGIYDASGTVRTTSTDNQRYTYTGREYDPDLNLYHFRARWYDSATGGFISRDPLGYVDGMSLYRGYIQTSNVDPSGTLLIANDDLWWRFNRTLPSRVVNSDDGVADRYEYTPQQQQQVEDMCTNNGLCFCATKAYVRSRSIKTATWVGYELKWTIEGKWVDDPYSRAELPSFRYFEWWDHQAGINKIHPNNGEGRYEGLPGQTWHEFPVVASDSFFNGQAKSVGTATTGE